MGKKRLLAIIVVLFAAVLLFACESKVNAGDDAKSVSRMNPENIDEAKDVIDEQGDGAESASWMNLDNIGEAKDVIVEQGDELIEVFSYIASHNESSGEIYIDENGTLVNEKGIDISEVYDSVISLLQDCPLKARLYATQSTVELWVSGTDYIGPYRHMIMFDIQEDMTQSELDALPVDSAVKIAKHWYVLSEYFGG
jgi:hypothetical protein